MTRVAISQSNYLPWKGYFDLIDCVDTFVIFDRVQFTKRDWRNRNKIKTAQGLKWISIPVSTKGKVTQAINEVEVSDTDWPSQHLNKLQNAYREAPFLSETLEVIAPLIKSNKTFLSEINDASIQALCDYLDITTPLLSDKIFDLTGDASQKLLNICKALNATTYVSGPTAKAYLDVSRFSAAGIEVEWMSYEGYPQYPQLHGEFEHGVSILDVMVHTGRAAKDFIKRTS